MTRGLQLPKVSGTTYGSSNKKILTEKDIVKRNVQYSEGVTPGAGITFEDVQEAFHGHTALCLNDSMFVSDIFILCNEPGSDFNLSKLRVS